MMMEVKCSFETLILTRATRRNVPEDGIVYSLSPVKTSNLTSDYFVPGENHHLVFLLELKRCFLSLVREKPSSLFMLSGRVQSLSELAATPRVLGQNAGIIGQDTMGR
jgi:hypothetical protein